MPNLCLGTSAAAVPTAATVAALAIAHEHQRAPSLVRSCIVADAGLVAALPLWLFAGWKRKFWLLA